MSYCFDFSIQVGFLFLLAGCFERADWSGGARLVHPGDARAGAADGEALLRVDHVRLERALLVETFVDLAQLLLDEALHAPATTTRSYITSIDANTEANA